MTDPIARLVSPLTHLNPPPIPLPKNPAIWMHERIVRSINSFEEELDEEHEVGARLVNFGLEMTLYIDDVGAWGPDMIIFHGTSPDGNPVTLLQHISQLSVLLIALKKEQEKPRRIGFQMMESIENDDPQK